MRRVIASLLLLLPSSLWAQQPAPPPAPPPAPSLRVGTDLVLVDVTVRGKDGKPLHGLTAQDFLLTEDKKQQPLQHVEEHTAASGEPMGPKLPPMPAGTFTNYTPVPQGGALNILLLDSLNTPMQDQSFVRYELQQYIKHAQPGTRIAIFGLSTGLFMLQGFSSDPDVLKDAIEHKLLPRPSELLNHPVSGQSDSNSTLAQNLSIGSSLSLFEARSQSFRTEMRLDYTIDAFNTLAHYLSAFPGRKNLLWFSGAFPINILPDPLLGNPFYAMEDNNPQFREMTNLMARSQVAVYPIDARGLMADPTFSAENSGSNLRNPGAQTMRFLQNQADEHSTMQQLADDTGGQAFYNTNDLSKAVQSAIEDGSNYYTLVYAPADHRWNGAYRNIRVTLAPGVADSDIKLNYRHGYFADDPNKKPGQHTDAAATTPEQVNSLSSGAAYARAAMAHGAPTPEELLFKASLLPASSVPETALAPRNQIDPLHPLPGPYRRVLIDFAIPGSELATTLGANGRHTGAAEFSALLYDNEGRLLNAIGETVNMNMTADVFALFQQGAGAHLELSVPARGNGFLRIGIRDLTTNRIGALEVPVSSILALPPAVVPAQPTGKTPPSSHP
ncbi:MAG: VWA domain-containing protein [Acidobacteriaceae bacterium]|nr:VWA domain-containing protein [Acidobacteriaceae bacterium]